MNAHSPYVPRKNWPSFWSGAWTTPGICRLAHGVQKSHALCLCSQRIRMIGFVRELRKHCKKKRCEFLFFSYIAVKEEFYNFTSKSYWFICNVTNLSFFWMSLCSFWILLSMFWIDLRNFSHPFISADCERLVYSQSSQLELIRS